MKLLKKVKKGIKKIIGILKRPDMLILPGTTRFLFIIGNGSNNYVNRVWSIAI